MKTDRTGSDGDGRTFYAPATYQFSAAPGRVERALSRALRQRGAVTARPPATAASRAFYAPATFQFSTAPGRVERTFARLFRQRGAMDGRPRPDVTEYGFYAPASTRDAFLRRGKRPEPR